jgi:hypothetical protein
MRPASSGRKRLIPLSTRRFASWRPSLCGIDTTRGCDIGTAPSDWAVTHKGKHRNFTKQHNGGNTSTSEIFGFVLLLAEPKS